MCGEPGRGSLHYFNQGLPEVVTGGAEAVSVESLYNGVDAAEAGGIVRSFVVQDGLDFR